MGAAEILSSQLTVEDFARLAAIIEKQLGVKMPASKRLMLQARIARRARELSIVDLSEYCRRIFANPSGDEVVKLLDLATTNLTYFFREPLQLEALTPRLAEIGRDAVALDREVQVWSGACSRGHEPYTLAIMLDELGARPRFRIHASDVSTRVLEEATRAVYPMQEIEPIKEEWRERHLLRSREPNSGVVRVSARIRAKVRFFHQNLMHDRYDVPRDLDVILLRNVLIYFDAPTQRQVIARAAKHLRPGGLLCVGLSESLHGHDVALEHTGLGIYRSTNR